MNLNKTINVEPANISIQETELDSKFKIMDLIIFIECMLLAKFYKNK
jgi:hypothetical protein